MTTTPILLGVGVISAERQRTSRMVHGAATAVAAKGAAKHSQGVFQIGLG
jgi:hypothetical protein